MATTETMDTLKEKIVALQVKTIDTELQAGKTEDMLKVMKVEMANKLKEHDEEIARANGQGAAMAVQLNDVLERMIEKDQEIQTVKKDVQERMIEKDKVIQTVKEETEKVKTDAKESATGVYCCPLSVTRSGATSLCRRWSERMTRLSTHCALGSAPHAPAGPGDGAIVPG